MSTGRVFDTVIVSLGAMGSAAAWQLARRGQCALGIDRWAPPHPHGSTHGETRITRQAIGEGEHYTPYALRSHELWREIEAATGAEVALPVSFGEPGERVELQYTKVTSQGIDGDHASLDAKLIELEVTQLRGSSTNASVYPPDLTKTDYDAYAVTAVGEATRTRIAVIVRRDTNASKVLGRAQPTDKLRIRGTARLARNPGALAVVADTAEIV